MTPEQFVWFVSGVVQSEMDRAISQGKSLNPNIKTEDIEYLGPMKTIRDALNRVERKEKEKITLNR